MLVPASIRRATAAGAAALGYAGAIVFGVLLYTHSKDPSIVAGGGLSRDRLYACAAVLIGGIGIATVLLAARDRMRDDHIAEYFSLLAVAGAGMVFFVGSSNLMTLFLALEWFSISLYILCAIDGDNPSGLEAGLKYLVTGGFGSAILLFGSALVYGATGKIGFAEIGASPHGKDALLVVGLAMLIVGLGFKSSAAPFHQWTPDVYEGAPTTVTAFMSSATKVAALLLTLRVLLEAFPQEAHLWSGRRRRARLRLARDREPRRDRPEEREADPRLLLRLARRLPADRDRGEQRPRRAGAPLLPAALQRDVARLVRRRRRAGAGARPARRRSTTSPASAGSGPSSACSFWLFLFGFAGFPLTGGFWAKIYVFSAAVDRGWNWLVVVGVVATMVSLVYYLNLVRVLYLRADVVREPAPTATPAVAGGSPPAERLLGTAVLACVVVTVGTFIFVGPLTDIAKDATAFLPF